MFVALATFENRRGETGAVARERANAAFTLLHRGERHRQLRRQLVELLVAERASDEAVTEFAQERSGLETSLFVGH